jgi:hypothetical protein
LKPLRGLTVNCRVAVFPAVTVVVEEPRVSEKSWPVPDSAIDCGLPAAPSVTVTDAERLPDAPGVNFTLMEQLPPAATDEPQLFVTAKSAAFVPAATMLPTLRALLPLLVSVTACAALVMPTTCAAKVRLLPEGVAVGRSKPVPDRLID